MSKRYQLRLDLIEASLRDVQVNFERINGTLKMRREPIAEVIIKNMMSGYAYLNELLLNKVNLVRDEYKHHALELNQVVLCGTDDSVRYEFAGHMRETAIRFYNQSECNISKIVKWNKKHKSYSAWERAARTYTYMLSRPQLFFEGNHRTGALIMSAILAHDGLPPFVLTTENAIAYFDPSTLAKLTEKSFFTKLYKLPTITKNFTKFLKNQADKRFLQTIKV
ncbi:hypothetical protein [Pseudodesulfovibrio sp.]|uniref:hypothetical protein n=1 Tax=unclassified Pseudodesulfovibrio TaxID=2661612 RepID=UPI003B00CC06